MRKVRAWLCRLAGVFNRKKREAELAEEIESHLHMHIDDNLRSGMPPEEARRLALIKLGGIATTKESYRDHLGFPLFEALVDDLRYSIRMLRKTPAFTTIALLTLILGIGANTAVFTITYHLFLRHLPVPWANRLALITYDLPTSKSALTLKMFHNIRKKQQVFSGMAAWADYPFQFSENGEVELIDGAFTSGDSFSTLQLRPAVGRLLTTADDQPNGGPNGWTAVISHDYWREQLHSDPKIVGRTMVLESVPMTIVGVMPAGFEGLNVSSYPKVVVPAQFALFARRNGLELRLKRSPIFTVIGRMKNGVGLTDASADVKRIATSVVEQSDLSPYLQEVFFRGARLTVSSGAAGHWGRRTSYKASLVTLQLLVTILLILCCTNLAGLFSARAAARHRDLVIRSALGAHRLRLARQLVIENVIVVGLATALTLLFVSWPAKALIRALASTESLAIVPNTRPDVYVFAFTLTAAFCVILITGLFPAWRITRTDLNTNLSESSEGPRIPFLNQVGSWLIPLQVCISVLLVVASSLFAGTLYNLLTTHLGFHANGIIIFPTGFENRSETQEQRAILYNQIFERLNRMPGIEIATGESFPVLKEIRSSMRFASLGPSGNGQKNIDLSCNVVGTRYFEAMGTKIVAGRGFLSSDEHSASHVCVLNESAAKHLFPEGQAVGSYLNQVDPQTGKTTRYDIVGVVEDSKFTNMRESVPDSAQLPFHPDNITPELQLVIKTNDVNTAISSVRKVLREFLPNAPLFEPITMQQQVNQSVARERLLAALSTSFGVLALLLTAIGVYGTLAFQVGQRTTEIGVRLALGASRTSVLGMILRQALLPLVIGAVLGTVAALASSRVIVSLLYEVRPHQPEIYIGALLLIGLVGFLAAWMPARRAASVDPVSALRSQ